MKDTELSGLQGGVCALWSPGDAMGVESSGLVAKAYVRPPSKKKQCKLFRVPNRIATVHFLQKSVYRGYK